MRTFRNQPRRKRLSTSDSPHGTTGGRPASRCPVSLACGLSRTVFRIHVRGSDHFNFRLVFNATHTRPVRSAPDWEVTARVPCERATVQPSPAAVTPGGSTPHVSYIGLTRERAARTRLVRFAREAGARVPCERATVQPTVQSATTAGAVTPGGSTPT